MNDMINADFAKVMEDLAKVQADVNANEKQEVKTEVAPEAPVNAETPTPAN